jgi:chemotaxis protein methyltransferase CheR
MTVAAHQSAQAQRSIVEGEFAFTDDDFRRIAGMLHGDTGIALPESKATLAYSRLAKRLRALGLSSFKEYCALVASAEGVGERQKMLAALTTNVTRFFREPHHFEHLRERILPPLLASARRGGAVRIWSAGCSSGQEPFSTAMTILEMAPDAVQLDIKVLASDIDPDMVDRGRQGVFPGQALQEVPPALRRKWFKPLGPGSDQVRALDEVRALISFRELNLIGQWPMKGRFDAIFCRNVVIYFEEETQARIWSRFVPLLAPGGALYIGHSERVTGPAAEQLTPDGITTYRLKSGAAA